MSNPFKKIADNAKNTKNVQQHLGAKSITTSYVVDCETCGAPRPKNTNLTTCSYCKSVFMNTNTTIKPDA
ncbi:MAG: hypothetical protein NWQ38_04520 [Cellulophaga sp.]|nr:hypothetical protein [Cellulophaga sp.]